MSGSRPSSAWLTLLIESAPMFIDCHAHLEPFTDAEVGEILDRAEQVGVRAVISAGTTIQSSERSLELSEKYEPFFSGVGIHPMDIPEPFTDTTYETLRDMALSTEKVLVISEVGLDFMEGAPDRVPHLQQAAAKIPLENIVLETDAAPQPFKAKRENWTEPRHVAVVAQTLAELKGIEVEEVEEVTTRNMRRVLGDGWSVVEKYVGVQ